MKKNKIKYGWIEITNQCNLRCRYCYTSSTNNVGEELRFGELKKILRDFKTFGVKIAVISGGEPTLRKDLNKILEYGAKDMGLKMVLVTNGTMLKAETIEVLSLYKIPVQLSLDSVDSDVYKKARGADLLSRVTDNIDLLLKNNIEVALAGTLTQISMDSMDGLIDFALDKGIQNIHIGEMVPGGRGSINKEIFSNSIYPIYKKLYDYQKKHFLFLSIDIIEKFLFPLILNEKKRYYCNAMGGKTVEVGYDGHLYFCGYMRESNYLLELSVRKAGLLSAHALLKDRLKQFHICANELAGCKDCKHMSVCAGGCRAAAYYYSGSISGKNPYCEATKKIIDRMDRDLRTGKLDEYKRFLVNRSSNGESLVRKIF